jgi:hypothetical protein
MFEGMLKHTGQLNNTGKNVVVVFMQLPEDPDNALVIDTDALPDMFNESLRKIVESTESQQSKNLADVLARRMSPDGSGTTMLQKFHQAGRLMKTPVGNVTMVPRRGVRWPLTEVIAAMTGPDAAPAGFDDLDPETKAAIASEVKKFNVHASNQEGQTASGRKADAAALLEMAKLLEADAQGKREQAYRIDPSLKPKVKTLAKAEAAPVVETAKAEVPAADSVDNRKAAGRKTAGKKAA